MWIKTLDNQMTSFLYIYISIFIKQILYVYKWKTMWIKLKLCRFIYLKKKKEYIKMFSTSSFYKMCTGLLKLV